MSVHRISTQAVSIIIDDTGPTTDWAAYANSPSGRACLSAEQPPEVVAGVMEVWGDTPTVPDEPVLMQPTPEQETAQQIAALKAQLTATDYQAIKYAEGWLTAAEYEPVKAQRQAWRDEVNRLEEGL